MSRVENDRRSIPGPNEAELAYSAVDLPFTVDLDLSHLLQLEAGSIYRLEAVEGSRFTFQRLQEAAVIELPADLVLKTGYTIRTRSGTVVNQATGKETRFSKTEWRLVKLFISNPGRIITNAELLRRVWGNEYADDIQYLRVWVSRIREKIGEQATGRPYSRVLGLDSVIRTHPGIGYSFNPSLASEEVAS